MSYFVNMKDDEENALIPIDKGELLLKKRFNVENALIPIDKDE